MALGRNAQLAKYNLRRKQMQADGGEGSPGDKARSPVAGRGPPVPPAGGRGDRLDGAGAGAGGNVQALLADKDRTIDELRDTVELLELKVSKLEQLVQIKDAKIDALAKDPRLLAGSG